MENSTEVIAISKISEKRRVLSSVGDKAVAKLKSKYLTNMNFYQLQYLPLKTEEAVIQFSIIYRISMQMPYRRLQRLTNKFHFYYIYL